VHLGQFVGMAIITVGLVGLFFGIGARDGTALWLSRLALLWAGAAIAVYAVLQAVDGWP